MLTSGQGPPPRSNIWCGKCHGYGHLVTECPTTSRIVPDQPHSLFCTYCLQNNHTEDACFIKKTHERRKAQGQQTNYNFLDQTNTSSYEIGPPPWPFIQRGIPEPYMQQQGLPAQSRPPLQRVGNQAMWGNRWQSSFRSPYRRETSRLGTPMRRNSNPIVCYNC